MSTIQIEKVITRKTKKKDGFTTEQVLEIFKGELLKNAEKLAKVFPTVIISSFGSEKLLSVDFGVSYDSAMWTTGKAHVSGSTQNIAIRTYGKPVINIGYGANSASCGFNGKSIPLDTTMTKIQLKRLFKQSIEALVSCAYREKSDFYKKDEKVSNLWIDGVKTEIKH